MALERKGDDQEKEMKDVRGFTRNGTNEATQKRMNAVTTHDARGYIYSWQTKRGRAKAIPDLLDSVQPDRWDDANYPPL